LTLDRNWVVYLVRCADQSLYCGITNDLKNAWMPTILAKGPNIRDPEHPSSFWEPVSQMTKSEALKLEHRIKKTPANRKLTELDNGKAYPKMKNTQILQDIQKELQSVVKSFQQLADSLGNMATAVGKLAQPDSSKATQSQKSPDPEKSGR
jgi:putative endonuclease